MWKDHSSSIAISLLSEVPAYEGTNLEEMKFLVERSFVPPLKNFEIFVVCDMIEDIILIYGCVLDFDTKEIFIGKYYHLLAQIWAPARDSKRALSLSLSVNFE